MKIGTITQVSGPVVDVEFEAGHLPKIKEALSVELNGQTRVMEVAQHMSERVVRCIMLAGSEGLARGMKVTAPGKTIEVPVGEQTLGRMFNVLGQPIDGGEPLPAETPRKSIYRDPPSFADQSPAVRSWRPASRSSTCCSRIPRAARSACSAAPVWVRPC